MAQTETPVQGETLAMPDKEVVILGEEKLAYLEQRAQDKTLDYAEVDELLRHVPALCQTVRALREENERLGKHVADINHDFEAANKHCEEYHQS